MIDLFTLALTHGLLLLALGRLLFRADLDADDAGPPAPRRPWHTRTDKAAAEEPSGA